MTAIKWNHSAMKYPHRNWQFKQGKNNDSAQCKAVKFPAYILYGVR